MARRATNASAGRRTDPDKHKLADHDQVANEGSFSSTSSSDHAAGSFDCYNSKTGELLGRTMRSWCKLFAFFGLFSAMVAVFWGIFMGIFFQTLDFYIPKFHNQHSLIWESPGLGFRPAGGLGYKTVSGESKGLSVYSSLIWFRHGANGNYQNLQANLDRFLEEYEPGFFANQGASLTPCSFELTTRKGTEQSCEFNKEWLSDQGSAIKCITEENFGYKYGEPCILLKMNRVYNWIPDPYTIEEVRNHTSMPKSLKADIEKIWQAKCADKPDWSTLGPCPYLNMVWLHCDGENSADKENLGPVTYTPFRGFPGYFFPYRNQRGYLSPIVMFQLKKPTPGVLMNLECTAWARNIKHNRLKRSGLVHFEFLMD